MFPRHAMCHVLRYQMHDVATPGFARVCPYMQTCAPSPKKRFPRIITHICRFFSRYSESDCFNFSAAISSKRAVMSFIRCVGTQSKRRYRMSDSNFWPQSAHDWNLCLASTERLQTCSIRYPKLSWSSQKMSHVEGGAGSEEGTWNWRVCQLPHLAYRSYITSLRNIVNKQSRFPQPVAQLM